MADWDAIWRVHQALAIPADAENLRFRGRPCAILITVKQHRHRKKPSGESILPVSIAV